MVVSGTLNVIIVSHPAGTPVSGQPNTFDYPILSNVTLSCLVTSTEGSIFTVTSYQWNTTQCYTNTAFNNGNPSCFPHGQTTQNVTGTELTAEDAGNVSCIATIGEVHYNSLPLTIRISGIAITGGVESTGSNEITSNNRILDYSFINPISGLGLLFHCVTGLGPTGGENNADLGRLYFNNSVITNGECTGGQVIQARGGTVNSLVGVINVHYCEGLTNGAAEGVYTCTIRNSSMMDESIRVGVYSRGRTAPVITTTISSVSGVIGAPLTLSCISEGSPPDTFIWMKDGVTIITSTNITTISQTSTASIYRSNYMINNFSTNNIGTYTCSVKNPIGYDSHNIMVVSSTLNVRIVSHPAGTPVSGQPNTFDYPILSNVTLSCLVTSTEGSIFTVTSYQWNTTQCYSNTAFNNGNPSCFPHGQTTQNVTGPELTAEDAGTVSCIAIIGEVNYYSTPIKIRVSDIVITGSAESTGSNAITTNNTISDYSFINLINGSTLLFRCVTGLGPSDNETNADLGRLYFNGSEITNGECTGGQVIQARGGTLSNLVGVINVHYCEGLTNGAAEGVYTCTIRNSSMMDESIRVGVYSRGRTAPVITTTISSVSGVIGAPLTLTCISEGSPPDTFTWMKDGITITTSTNITTISQTSTASVYRSDYMINSFSTNNIGTYTCSVKNPIGNDSHNIMVVGSTLDVRIVSHPAGTPVSGQPNTFDYPILSNVTLSCLVTSTEGSIFTATSYQWNTTQCYSNTAFNNGNPSCFPHGQTTQNVTGTELNAEDAGVVSCIVTIGEVNYYSTPLTIRISGIAITGSAESTGSDVISTNNKISDYSFINLINGSTLLFRCVTGLGPSDNETNADLGRLYFSGSEITNGECTGGQVIQARGGTLSNLVGVINVHYCEGLTNGAAEGVYTCTIRNSSMMDESIRVGVYSRGRTAPVITTTISNVAGVIGAPLTLSCISEGSPPDTFTWMKDGVAITTSTNITTISQTSTASIYRSDYMINSFSTNNIGTYTCSVKNPIGNDSHNISVFVNTSLTTLLTIYTPMEGYQISITEGSNGSITCLATGYPPPTILWLNSDSSILNTSRLYSDNAVVLPTHVDNITGVSVELIIRNVSREDSGVYTCSVNNDLNYTTVRVAVNVQFPPEIIAGPQNVTVVNGNTAMINCTAKGNPLPAIHWSVSVINSSLYMADTVSTPFDHRGRISDDFINSMVLNDTIFTELIINETILFGAASYTCISSNDLGTDSMTAVLTTVTTASLQLRLLSTGSCTEWTATNRQLKHNDISEIIIQEIRTRCSCRFTMSDIVDGVFSCEGSQGKILNCVVYRATIMLYNSHVTVEELLNETYIWLQSRPSIIIDGVLVSVDQNPTSLLDSDECLASDLVTTESNTVVSVIVGLSVTTAIVLLITIIVIFAVLFWWRQGKSKEKKKDDPNMLNSDIPLEDYIDIVSDPPQGDAVSYHIYEELLTEEDYQNFALPNEIYLQTLSD